MAEFIINQPIETTDAKIEVTISPNAPLLVGVTRFQLVVIDDAGNASDPAITEVIIRDTERPTAVLDIVPQQVEAGKSFALVGDRSSDVAPGKVVKYVWTMVSIPDRPIN
jgi:hypothetical protein